ncbi:MAG: hypothetical protein HYY17_03050 [Planctomycetes bacterium]|nr:hypothetical protein [Planctomycetota bacterium]
MSEASDGIEITEEFKVAEPTEKLIPTADPEKTVEAKATILPDDLRIFLRQETLVEIYEYSKTDLNHELGGVLVGTFHQWRGQLWIDVDGYIKAVKYVNTAASFKFTHDSFSAISREKERRFNDKPTLGWHHTHPGYGVFLSNYDRFIQEQFFNLPYNVALVVDPRASKFGFFQWKHGKIESCGFYFVRARSPAVAR